MFNTAFIDFKQAFDWLRMVRDTMESGVLMKLVGMIKTILKSSQVKVITQEKITAKVKAKGE